MRKIGYRAATPVTPPGDDDAEHTSTVWGRWGEIAAYRNKVRASIDGSDVEYFPIETCGELFNILLENPNGAVSKERLQELLSQVTGPDDTLRSRLDECGRCYGLDCPEHGEPGQSVRTCKTQFHADCPTKTASKLAQCALPDREGEQSYREVWLETSVILDGAEVETVLNSRLDQWVRAVQKLARRKANKGKILHRSYSVYLDRVSRLRWKVMFLEDSPGDSDVAVTQLCDEMNAVVVGDIRYHRGESALLQLMVDASCTLAGMAEDDPRWFSGYFYATNRPTRLRFHGCGVSRIEGSS